MVALVAEAYILLAWFFEPVLGDWLWGAALGWMGSHPYVTAAVLVFVLAVVLLSVQMAVSEDSKEVASVDGVCALLVMVVEPCIFIVWLWRNY